MNDKLAIKFSSSRKGKDINNIDTFHDRLGNSFILEMLTPLISICSITSAGFEISFCFTENHPTLLRRRTDKRAKKQKWNLTIGSRDIFLVFNFLKTWLVGLIRHLLFALLHNCKNKYTVLSIRQYLLSSPKS